MAVFPAVVGDPPPTFVNAKPTHPLVGGNVEWADATYEQTLYNLMYEAQKILVGPIIFNVMSTSFADGAKGDALQLVDAGINIVTDARIVNSASANFVAGDLGKIVRIDGAGNSGSLQSLSATITTVISTTQVRISAAAARTVTNANMWYGTDDTAAFNAAILAAQPVGGMVTGPARSYMLSNVQHKVRVSFDFSSPGGFGPLGLFSRGTSVGAQFIAITDDEPLIQLHKPSVPAIGNVGTDPNNPDTNFAQCRFGGFTGYGGSDTVNASGGAVGLYMLPMTCLSPNRAGWYFAEFCQEIFGQGMVEVAGGQYGFYFDAGRLGPGGGGSTLDKCYWLHPYFHGQSVNGLYVAVTNSHDVVWVGPTYTNIYCDAQYLAGSLNNWEIIGTSNEGTGYAQGAANYAAPVAGCSMAFGSQVISTGGTVPAGMTAGDALIVEGAGQFGVDLVTAIIGVNEVGHTVTAADPAQTSVTNAEITTSKFCDIRLAAVDKDNHFVGSPTNINIRGGQFGLEASSHASRMRYSIDCSGATSVLIDGCKLGQPYNSGSAVQNGFRPVYDPNWVAKIVGAFMDSSPVDPVDAYGVRRHVARRSKHVAIFRGQTTDIDGAGPVGVIGSPKAEDIHLILRDNKGDGTGTVFGSVYIRKGDNSGTLLAKIDGNGDLWLKGVVHANSL